MEEGLYVTKKFAWKYPTRCCSLNILHAYFLVMVTKQVNNHIFTRLRKKTTSRHTSRKNSSRKCVLLLHLSLCCDHKSNITIFISTSLPLYNNCWKLLANYCTCDTIIFFGGGVSLYIEHSLLFCVNMKFTYYTVYFFRSVYSSFTPFILQWQVYTK